MPQNTCRRTLTRAPFGCSFCFVSDPGELVADSQGGIVVRGGVIPGLSGVAAFRGAAPDPASIPVVLAAPHGGRCYPAAILAALRVPDHVLLRLEDRLVDQLAEAVAQETGASFIVAQAPRAMIDLNRAVEDVDWDMLANAPRAHAQRTAQHRSGPGHTGHSGHRARSGLGLVPRRLPGIGELWKGRLDHAELERRIALIHEPYHAAVETLVERVAQQWGAVLLIDLHSMPPLPTAGGAAAQFVIGDRFGTACDGELVASLFSHLAAARRLVAHNRPYAGGFVLDRHAQRSSGIHAVQIEIDRTAYLDAAMAERGPGFDSVVTLLVAMVRQLADDVAALGRDRLRWRAAAE
jgi:N-formylglutamate amidohydrolase